MRLWNKDVSAGDLFGIWAQVVHEEMSEAWEAGESKDKGMTDEQIIVFGSLPIETFFVNWGIFSIMFLNLKLNHSLCKKDVDILIPRNCYCDFDLK